MSEIQELYKSVINCQCCNIKRSKLRKDKTGFYENKILGEGGNFRCKGCKEIKPINEFEFVNKLKSTNRRKKCRNCRSMQKLLYYHKKKALQSNDNN